MPRYRIKYFNGRALYYSNTTASYSTSSVTLATSGDVEKNPGPNRSRSEDQEPSNISRKRPASEMSAEESNPYDIGIFRFPNARHLSNEQKYDLILKCWKPEPSYNFPKTVEGRNTRSFRYEWLRTYPWLRYSPMYDGAFCLPCVLFGNDTAFERLDKLFKSPLKLWTSAASKFSAYEKRSSKHKNSVTDLQLFKASMQNKRKDIDELLSAQVEKRIKENRERLSPIVKCILHCGKTNQALRGHRDDSTQDREQQGNFKDLIEFRIESGDAKLKEHLETASKNQIYLSTSKFIRDTILTNINNGSRYYSIMADEATDISNKEQLSMVVRYVDSSKIIRESFIGFCHLSDGCTGVAIKNEILKQIKDFGLDINLRQGYDGAGAVAGIHNGTAALIRSEYSKAIFVHCSSHRLNLCVAASCSIQIVREMMDNCKSIADFFNLSPKRQSYLIENVKTYLPGSNHFVLKDYVEQGGLNE